jgi:hypothetical protein
MRHNSNNLCRHGSGTLFGARITGFPSQATPDPWKLVPLSDSGRHLNNAELLNINEMPLVWQ